MDANTDTALRALTITRTFDAPRALVFKAWTEAEHIARWWGCPQTQSIKVMNDLREGGAIRAEMTLDDGALHIVVGTYLEIAPPERLSFTWNWEHDEMASDTIVTITLEEVAAGTEMTLHHAIFDTTELRDAHGEGWTRSLERLESLVAASAID